MSDALRTGEAEWHVIEIVFSERDEAERVYGVLEHLPIVMTTANLLSLHSEPNARDAALREKDAELELLRAVADAARPIAEAADCLEDETADRSEIWEMPVAMALTAGDLRQVKAALDALDAAPKPAAPDDGWRPIESAEPASIDDTFDVWLVATCNGQETNARRVADAYYDGNAWCDVDGDPLEWKDEIGQATRVTHWRPLSPPPAPPQRPLSHNTPSGK